METIRIEKGRIHNLPYHNARMNRTRRELFGAREEIDLAGYIHPGPHQERTKCRVEYTREVLKVEYVPYRMRPVHSLRLVTCDEIDYSYKSTDRQCLNDLFAQRAGHDDILIIRDGLLTDTSICNVALWNGASWITPARPLLCGTMRAYLLDKGLVQAGDIPVEDLPTLRHLGSYLQGHPCIHIPGVDMSSGSLGQGISAAVGMALGAKMDKRDFRVYTLLGDGEIEEGQVWEAAMLAAHRKLDNLVVIVDNNGLQIDGNVADVNSPYPIDKKFEAFNFHVINVADGNDFDQLKAAFDEARTVTGMPTAIITKTVKGKGVSFMENQVGWHGKAPNDEEYAIAMAELEKAGEALCQK